MSQLRKIIHIDMDCFYASVEIRNNPTLKNKPVAVGGAASRRGVLTTCNYEARKFGLHSAMSTALAIKKCPNLIVIPVNMSLYKQVSAQIHQIFQRYTHIIEPLSLDEAYLDVTDCKQCSGSATWIAQKIRQEIWQELQLTASAGVAPLKFLAKIASDYNKPNGQFVIHPSEVQQFVKELPLSKIPGVGKVTTQKLLQMGLKTCSDVQQQEQILLVNIFGKMGVKIWEFSHGIDNRQVQPHRERKSVGIEKTLDKNIASITEAKEILAILYPELLKRLEQHGFNVGETKFRKIGIKLKFEDFQTTTLEKTEFNLAFTQFVHILDEIWLRCNHRKVRLIGIFINFLELDKYKNEQMELW